MADTFVDLIGHGVKAGSVGVGDRAIVMVPLNTRPSVAVHPGAGGTLAVDYSLSPISAVRGDTANWVAWTHGASATKRLEMLAGPVTAIRFTPAVATGVWEVLA
jgi:hypothetical protein